MAQTATTIERKYKQASDLLCKAYDIAADIADQNQDDPSHGYTADTIMEAIERIDAYTYGRA